MRFFFLITLIATLLFSCEEKIVSSTAPVDVWIDPAFEGQYKDTNIVVWFEHQFLPKANSYTAMQDNYKMWTREKLRLEVTEQLKKMSGESFAAIESKLHDLEDQGLIEDIKPHWIINGFSCKVLTNDINQIADLKGINYIYKKVLSDPGSKEEYGPRIIKKEAKLIVDENTETVWNLKALSVPFVWQLGYLGQGVLNVVHDFGFRIEMPPLTHSIHINKGEIPNNGKDDDANGYVDDYHGFNFDQDSPIINNGNKWGRFNHGSLVASIIAGGRASGIHMGLAPGSSWAPVRGFLNFEQMIEWAIDQKADTYTMSFSLDSLNEFRSHWRKVIEQASYCGLFFISGAGNAADPKSYGYRDIPAQMNLPEDIPEAVFSVSGVDSLYRRPKFSGQGPVVWQTHYYSEGRIEKPDFAMFNDDLQFSETATGKIKSQARGNSFAGPQLTGVIALMLNKNRNLKPWEIKKILVAVAKDLGNPGYDNQFGYGMINAFDAVNAVPNPTSRD